MSVHYSQDFKKELVRAYMADNKSTFPITADYKCLNTTNTSSQSNKTKKSED